MYVDRIEIAFDAGHRLLDYPGKCASPHGHSFRAEVFVAASELDRLGLALDFGELRTRCKAWIDRNWDHGFLLNDRDLSLVAALRSVPEAKLYLFAGVNPTAEAMSQELYQATRAFGWDVRCVRIWESARQYAEYAADPVPTPGPVAEAIGR
jgi:6-pyruvoyltetrahydropterin/6-carboxytetrahydropterin synthase